MDYKPVHVSERGSTPSLCDLYSLNFSFTDTLVYGEIRRATCINFVSKGSNCKADK